MAKKRVTHVKKKDYKSAAYKLLVAISITGIIVPSGIIVKAGLGALLAYLYKLKKSGMKDEDINEIKNILDSAMPSRLKSSYVKETEEQLIQEVAQWNATTWEKPVISYPTNKRR